MEAANGAAAVGAAFEVVAGAAVYEEEEAQ